VYSLALQSNGQMLLGGWFKKVDGQSPSFLARLNAGRFRGSPCSTPAVDADVRALALQADGRILVGGDFTNITGQARSRIARLKNNEPASSDAES
jgi:hypothetical protein